MGVRALTFIMCPMTETAFSISEPQAHPPQKFECGGSSLDLNTPILGSTTEAFSGP